MAKVMFNLTSPDRVPTLESVAKEHGLKPGDLDQDFGVIPVSPAEHVYTVLVEEHAAARMGGAGSPPAQGPFSNPRIEPFDLKQ